MNWDWIPNNIDAIVSRLVAHLAYSLIPVVIGLIIAVPLGWLASRSRPARAILVPAAGLLYTIPSLALFVALPGIIGTPRLDPINVVVALAIYTTALLVRTVADALAAVPGMVIAAATAMGFKPGRRFAQVELPLSIPVLIAGLRVATVTNISLVAIGALIGAGGLGYFFTDGSLRNNGVEILTGIVLIVAIAVVFDQLLVALGKLATPWAAAGQGRRA